MTAQTTARPRAWEPVLPRETDAKVIRQMRANGYCACYRKLVELEVNADTHPFIYGGPRAIWVCPKCNHVPAACGC